MASFTPCKLHMIAAPEKNIDRQTTRLKPQQKDEAGAIE
jgi:hypothetical protein